MLKYKTMNKSEKSFNYSLLPDEVNRRNQENHIFSFPGRNASVARTFSNINDMWTSEKSPISVNCMESMITINSNCNKLCI